MIVGMADRQIFKIKQIKIPIQMLLTSLKGNLVKIGDGPIAVTRDKSHMMPLSDN